MYGSSRKVKCWDRSLVIPRANNSQLVELVQALNERMLVLFGHFVSNKLVFGTHMLKEALQLPKPRALQERIRIKTVPLPTAYV
jgi:hypothetical protein